MTISVFGIQRHLTKQVILEEIYIFPRLKIMVELSRQLNNNDEIS